jgi:hypothetical protein
MVNLIEADDICPGCAKPVQDWREVTRVGQICAVICSCRSCGAIWIRGDEGVWFSRQDIAEVAEMLGGVSTDRAVDGLLRTRLRSLGFDYP